MLGQAVEIIELVANYLGIIIIPIMTIILGRRVFLERRQIKKLNVIRFLIFCIFLSLSWLLLWEFLYESTPLSEVLNADLIISINTFSLYSFGLGLMITLAISMVSYTNRWESLYFMPFFIFLGMFIVFLLTEIAIFLLPYVFAGGVVAVVFLFGTGFKLKDNSSLGLAIFATLVFPTLIAEKTIVGQILSLAYPIFGLIFALGYFKLFKADVVEKNE
ncbi:MAG: hypothetical protein ACTSO6_03610 [Promethearchaeota archaeon]